MVLVFVRYEEKPENKTIFRATATDESGTAGTTHENSSDE